jgi:hypothetical protein
MEFLASDAMNGRAGGTRDEWITATYIGAQLRRWGLEPMGDEGGYVQTVTMERPELGAAPVLTIGDRTLAFGKEFSVAGMSGPRMTGTLAKYEKGKPAAAGSAVIVPGAVTQEMFADIAATTFVLAPQTACGPFRQPTALPRIAARTVGTPPPPARPSCVALDDATFKWIADVAVGTAVTLEGQVKGVMTSNTWNTIGRITGRDPRLKDEVILLSAHMDHLAPRPNAPAGADNIFNGADDDASGSIAVLELAEEMSKGPKPKRTVVFSWFGSEETGGAGSGYFVDKPVVPLDRLVAQLQFEMLGRPDPKVPPHTLWLTGYERSNLGAELAKRGAKLVQDPHPDMSFFTRSDNIRFARRGVIAHTVSSYGLHKEYHTPEDEIRLIDFAHMTDAIRSMVAPIRWLANTDWKPTWNPGGRPQ